MQAWSRVDKAVRRVGPYQSVVFDDAVVHRVIDEMGGWIKLCNTPSEEDYKFQGLEFSRRYRAYVIAGGAGSDYPRHLIGMTEAENNTAGFKRQIPPPVLIGTEKGCLEVLKGGSDGRTLLTHSAKSVKELLAQANQKAIGGESSK